MPQIARNYWQHIRSFGGFARVSKHTSTYIIPPAPIYLSAPKRPFRIDVRTPPSGGGGDVWVWSTSYVDASSAWSSETNAYDDNTATEALTYVSTATLELDLADAITCDKVAIHARKYTVLGGVNGDPNVKIELYYGGGWNTLYNGTITKQTWVEKAVSPSQSVTKARISCNDALNNSGGTELYFYLAEFKFHEAEIPVVSGELVAILQDAFDVKLELAAGAADNIMFSLPADDPKLSYFDNHNYDIWVRDQNGDVLASGVMDIKEPDGDALKETLTLTGFMAQLKREYITSYSAAWESVAVTMENLLDLQLSDTPIHMGTCEYTAAEAVSFADCSIYDALIQLWEFWGKDGYFEVDENRALHWRVVGAYAGQQIRYRKNLVSIKPKEDYQEHANKIYAYGRDASGNVIKLSDTGFYAYDYVKDDTSIAAYGTLVDTITDNSIATAVQLYSWAANELAARKDPSNSYSVDMVNLHYQTGYEFNKLVFSEYYRLISEPLAINLETNIVAITYNDLSNPLDVSVELSGKTRLLTDTIADLQKRL